MRLLLTTLFVIFLGVFADFDCPTDACFGQPEGCIPGQNCRFVFKFDEEGNLDLYLRDFVDPHAYAAFPLSEEANQTYTYLICLPHAQKRMRAIAKLGQPIVVSEYEMARTVRKIRENYFACSFPAAELTESFEHDKNFFITTGQFVDNLVLNDGEELYSFESKQDSEEDADYEPIFTEPISGNIKRTARLTDDVYTGEDSKQANDAIDMVEKIANNKKQGSDLEEDIESVMGNKKKQSSRQQEEEEEVENSEEGDFEQEIEKITRRPTRGNRKSTSRPNQNEEESDEDEDWEAAAKQLEKKEKKSRKSTRRGNSEEDDEDTRPSRRSRKQYEEDEDEDEDRRKRRIPKRKSRKDEDDEEEDDEEFDEDEDDAAAANFDIFLFSSFVIIAFGFVI